MNAQHWHNTDTISAMKKLGTSLVEQSRKAGLALSTFVNALNRQLLKGKLLIAQALNAPPALIWPARYFDEKGASITCQIKITKKNKLIFDIFSNRPYL